MSDDATRMMPPASPGGSGGQTGTFDRAMVAGSATQMPGMGMGATQQMPAGVSDPFRTQMGGTTTCAVCKSTTPLTESYCGECGFLLTSAVVAENLEIPQEEPAAAELVAEADGQRYKLRAGVNTLGRQGTDVLLNEGTISRVHARITVEGNTITVEDMGSSNGTKVGDLRIGANQPTQATPGQTLRFGNWRAVLQLGGMPAPASSGSAAATLMGGNQTVAMPATADNRTLVGVPNAVPATGENPTQVYQPGDLNPADAPLADMRNATIVEPAVADGNIVAHLTPTSGPGTAITVTEGSLSIGRRPANSIVISNDAYISGRHASLETDNTGTYLTDVGSTNGTSVNGQKLTAGERQLLLEGDEVQLGQTKYVFALNYEDAASVPIAPLAAEEPHTGQWSNPDGSPPGQEFGAINDPVYPPTAPRIQEVYHAVDNEVPNE